MESPRDITNNTVRKKPGVRLAHHLREEINLIADDKKMGRNEVLEAIIRLGLSTYYAKSDPPLNQAHQNGAITV